MRKYPGSMCPYLALTRDSAKNIMWDMLKEHTEEEKVRATFTEHNLTMTLENNARIQLFGADMKNFIRRLRGIKTPAAGIDEAQDFGAHLITLVDDVLTPAIIDYPDGWLALTGTPGPIPHGYFYEITEQGKYGFSPHRWSIYDNPYINNAKEFVDELVQKKQWLPDNPTLLREWHGKWVLDVDALVFKYSVIKNDYQHVDHSRDWDFVVGVDLGFDDADAIAVIGWHKHEKKTYLLHEQVDVGQTITELAEKIDAVIKQYDPLKVVIDTGGLGKKIAEEMRKRYALPIVAAEKSRKFEYIELLNDAMRMGRFFAKKDSRFADDCSRIKWETDLVNPEKPKISDNFHSDVCFIAGTLVRTKNGDKPIEEICLKDEILTRDGFKTIAACGKTGIEPILELGFSNGSMLCCTSNHPIFTQNRGFVRADALLYSDRVVTIPQCEKQSSIMERHSIDTHAQSVQAIGGITWGTTKKRNSIFTKPYGKMLMAICLSGIISIIRTGITQIINLIISNVLIQKVIIKSTGKTGSFKVEKIASIWNQPERSQKNGINLLKVDYGIKNTLFHGSKAIEKWFKPYAQYVGVNILETIQPRVQSFIAPINAEPKLGDNLVPMTLSMNADIVKKNFGPQDLKKEDSAVVLVQSRFKTKKETVYNLTVDDKHEYFANGILVSNCDSVLYAYREALHWITEPAPIILNPGSEPWFTAQAKEAEQLIIDRLEREKNDDMWGDLDLK